MMTDKKLIVTSPDHFYINGFLIDMDVIRHWFYHKTFAGHSPSQSIIKMQQLVHFVHRNGFDEFFTEDRVLDTLQKYLQQLDYYGHRIDDVCFKNGSVKYYRLIPNDESNTAMMSSFSNSSLDNYVVPETWWKARDPERFPRIEL